MKITSIDVFRVELPLHEGRYSWSGGKSVDVFDSTVVRVSADSGLVGWGEVCPLGPAYLPAYARGAREGIKVVGRDLIGADPTNLNQVNRIMDRALKGHPYVKSALDMACWDVLGKAAGLPVCELLGGRYGADFILYRAISQGSAEEMAASVAGYRADGYTRFQLKVGSGVEEDVRRIRSVSEVMEEGDILVADANTGWKAHEAIRVARGVSDLDVYIEQPCETYEECLSVRRTIDHPFVLDESVTNLSALVRARCDNAADVVNLKISKLGGITRLREARDMCVRLGIAMTIEDSWGGDIVTAGIAHLAHSTPPELLFTATDFNSYVTVSTARGAPRRENGRMAAPTEPGLGIEPIADVLGEPLVQISG